MPSKNHNAEPPETAKRPTGKKTCVHTWSIEPPNGPTSPGTCVDCGETKEFRNSVEISYWDNKRRHVPEKPPAKNPAATGGTKKKPPR